MAIHRPWGSGHDARVRKGCSGAAYGVCEVQPAGLSAKGVSDKLERGDTGTQDATLHSNAKMIETIYDRRKSRKATPAA